MGLHPLPLPSLNTITFTFFFILLLLRWITATNSPVHYDSHHAIAVNCGFPRNSIAFNGREWIGETDSANLVFFHGPGSKSVSLDDRSSSLDPTPYMTARASHSSFTYTFHVASGYKFIRLHFYPPPDSTTFKTSSTSSFLTVKSGPYTLLNNFSAFLAVNSLGLKSIVKEFTLYVSHDEPLSITFSPSRANPSDETFAFVNGIEVVPMPLGLYYTVEGDVGAYVVEQNYRRPIGKGTAMEMAHRLNVGGSSLSSAHDTSMFREWTSDSNHLIEESSVFPIASTNRIRYTETSKNSAPQRLYQTSWSMNRNKQVGKRVSFTWKLPVDLDFRYMIRMHFCELDYEAKESGQKEFNILINNQMVEPGGDLIRWGGEIGVAIHKDYLVTIKGDKMMGKRDLLIALYPCKEEQSTEFIDAVLKGIEVFKLSNLEDSLAGVNPVISPPHSSINRRFRMPTTYRNDIATLGIILVTLLNIIVYQIREWREKNWSKSPSLSDEELCRRFSFVEILSATNNFDKELEIGHGGFGKVYKGVINGKTKTVAIKRLSSESKQGEKEFRSEIDILSKLRHNHLVSLIGYCNKGREMILVYEYMEHGTLADHLHKNKRDSSSNVDVAAPPLSWEQRLNVCLGAARGLDYLHTNNEQDTIHRDVKSENILLDPNWVAKIADFGLCKVGTTNNTHISTDVKGTIGYLDPEYFLTRRLTKKSDVYAFGVVLWEALCGRPAVDTRMDGEQRSLVLWIQHCFKEGIVDSIIDSSLRGQISTRSLKLYLELANQCLHNQTNERPTMAEVTHGLESVLAAAISQGEEGVTDVTSDFEEVDGTDEIDLNSSSLPMSLISSTSVGAQLLDDNNMQKKKKKKTKFGKIVEKNFHALFRSIDIRRRKLPNNDFKIDGLGMSCDTTLDAIKETNQKLGGGSVHEILIMSQINHDNIVNFRYCTEEARKSHVLEYIDNRSLYDHLHDKNKNPLPWKKRLEICIGAAQGLHYLHSEMSEIVIHGDMKSANILLDRSWVAKVSDLDWESAALSSDCHVTTVVHGTMGYLDPDYTMTGQLTLESDIYAFGVVLLEVLCAKRPFVLFDEDDSEQHIVQYLKNIIQESIIDIAMDPYLVGRIAPDCLSQYLKIAMNCVEERGIDRPSIELVLSSLRNMLEMQKTWQFDVSLDPPSGAAISFMDSAADEWFHMTVGRTYNNKT